jgi:hypothetical protein
MRRPDRARASNAPLTGRAGGGILLLAAVVLAVLGCGGKPKPRFDAKAWAGKMATPGTYDPIVTPAAKKASEVSLPDDTPVVGVVVNGKARAYKISALSPLHSHVVNDLIDGVPVSVTYCDLAKCLRVYSHPAQGKPLELQQVGRSNTGLLLRYEGRIYAQATGKTFGSEEVELGLEQVEATETTWKAWRERYPDTDVYVGSDPAA